MHLTPRELDVIRLLISDHTNRLIAQYGRDISRPSSISTIAVADHIASLYRTLGAHDRMSAAAAYTQLQQREVAP